MGMFIKFDDNDDRRDDWGNSAVTPAVSPEAIQDELDTLTEDWLTAKAGGKSTTKIESEITRLTNNLKEI